MINLIAFIAPVEKLTLLPEVQKRTAYEAISSITDIYKLVSMLKNAYHYTYIIIDISIFPNTDDDILSALYQLKATSNTKVIIIAQGKCIGDIFLDKLVNLGIYDFVLSWVQDTAQQEMSDCIKGKELQDVSQFISVEETPQKKSLFNFKSRRKAEPIIIQVVGVCPRIGTTTQALRITKGLVSAGYKACYVEKNSSGHLTLIKNIFTQAQQINETTTIYSDLHLCTDINEYVLNAYEYIICDFGDYSDIPIDTLNSTYQTIIVAGSKAWEIFKLPPLMEIVANFDDVKYLFSFIDKKEEIDILDFMETNWTKTYFAEYSPDMFAELSDTEKQMYNKLILSSRK